MLGDVGRAGAGSELGHQPVERLGRLGADEPVVDLHARGPVAVGQALRLFEGDAPVLGGAAGVDPERRLGVLQQLGGAVQQAGDVGAHRHQVGAHRLGVEHVVERGRPVHLGRGHAHQVGDVLHGLGREPPVLLLGQVAERDERRAGLGIEGDELPGPFEGRRGQVHRPEHGGRAGPAGCAHRDGAGRSGHRSTSPITGSMVEQTATASASSPPRIITGSPWRLTKLGPRMCMR